MAGYTLAAYSCSTTADCEYLGTCVNSVCVCLPGWTGPSCGSLNLTYVHPSVSSGAVWPSAATIESGASSAWGFSPLYEPADGKYHAITTVACNATGVLGSGGATSWMAHLVSANAAGPYTFVQMFAPCVSFNPHATRAPNGTVLVTFRVNAVNEALPFCVDGTPLPPSVLNGSVIAASQLTPGDPEGGTNIYIATAPSFAGPWSLARITNITDSPYHNSNPSLLVLADGRTAMGFRYNPPGGERDAVAVAPTFTGPFTLVTALAQDMAGNDEDPFIWQERDGSLHLMQHNGPYGWHWFAPTVEGPWARSPTQATIYANFANGTDGSSVVFHRRERPEILFDPQTRQPAYLITGVEAQNAAGASVAYSYMHPVSAE